MGWYVECWHNTSNPSLGAQMPRLDNVPSFRAGHPIIREYQGFQGLMNLVQENSVDAIVDIYPPLVKDPMGRDPEVFRNIDCWPSRPNRPFWVVLEGPPGDSYNGVRCDEQLMNCDLFAVKSKFWTDYYCHSRSMYLKDVADYIKRNPKIFGKFRNSNDPFLCYRWNEQITRHVNSHTVVVGYPYLDPLPELDPPMIRRRWGIPKNQSIVTYLPWPGVLQDRAMFNIHYVVNFLPARLAWALWGGRLCYIMNSFKQNDERSVLQGIRKFCKKNSAFLLTKRRHSQVCRKFISKVSDLIVGDECYYPHTLLEALSVSDICIGNLSVAIYESIASSCYFINPAIPLFPNKFFVNFPIDSNIYDVEGISKTFDAEEMAKSFGMMDINDFRVNPDSRNSFLEEYVGPVDGNSSGRFLDAIEHLIQNGNVSILAKKLKCKVSA